MPIESTMTRHRRCFTQQVARALSAVAVAIAATGLAYAQAEGGLYIAGYGFTFERAVDDALSRNPPGQRFFLLVLPPHTDALTTTADKALVAARQRAVAGNGVLLVCQRDIDTGSVDASKLVAGVVAVRGWPAAGSDALPAGQRYFPDENPANLPRANEALRRLRSTCS
jgi:hypothetical protein